MGRDRYRRPDHFARSAQERGFAARSVFKLEEIDRRLRLLRPGQRVLDLGAAPGSWSQYAAARVGRSGRLLAVDLKPLAVALPDQARAIVGDVRLAGDELAAFAPYDVVLSDMAPSTTGTGVVDAARSLELFLSAVAVCDAVGAPGGAFCAKLFMSDDYRDARDALRARFADVRTLRPPAVRSSSREVFLAGLRRLHATAP